MAIAVEAKWPLVDAPSPGNPGSAEWPQSGAFPRGGFRSTTGRQDTSSDFGSYRASRRPPQSAAWFACRFDGSDRERTA